MSSYQASRVVSRGASDFTQHVQHVQRDGQWARESKGIPTRTPTNPRKSLAYTVATSFFAGVTLTVGAGSPNLWSAVLCVSAVVLTAFNCRATWKKIRRGL